MVVICVVFCRNRLRSWGRKTASSVHIASKIVNSNSCSSKNWYLNPQMKSIFSIILVLFTFSTLRASECYSYHTAKIYRIMVKGDAVYYQFTEKDPNGFSYVKQISKVLKGIDKASYKTIGEDESTLMFSDKNGYYMLQKSEQYDNNSVAYSKILGPNANQKHINGRLFFINQKWVYFNAWGTNITKVVLNELPEHISNIKCYSFGMYVKGDQEVFTIGIDLSAYKKYKITTIPNLNPGKVVYYACNSLKNEDYIADEQSIFSIRQEGSFEDVSPQFRALRVAGNFNALELIDPGIMMWRDGQRIIKRRDSYPLQGRDPLTGEEVDINFNYSTATPLVPAYGILSYIRYNNKIYPLWDDNFSTAYEIKTDVSKLRAIGDKIFKGDDFYYAEADNVLKIISTNISADAAFFPEVRSYGRSLPKALSDEKYIYFIGDRFIIHKENKKALTSKLVKQLGSFYLFNNSLFDGEKSYPITADYKSLSYLGSFVEVINDCSGDMPNTPQVAVKYHHFFKDKDVVYYFDERNKKLQVIQTANAADYVADDYEALQALYKIKDIKGVVKKARPALNYYLIFGGVLAVLGVFFYRRFKQ